MTEQEIKQILREINWDTTLTVDELYSVFTGKVESIKQVDKDWLYARILNSYSWYTVLKIFPRKDIKKILSDRNINILFPRSLREKYKNVRSILYE